jgi:septin family protein
MIISYFAYRIVDNEEHCDFIKLRQMLIRSHMEELKDITTMELYEQYRTERMLSETFKVDIGSRFKFVSFHFQSFADLIVL